MNYAEVKKVVLGHYSRGNVPKCLDCGTKDNLQIDHTNENGKEERKKYGSGYNFYRHLIKNKFPKGYKVRCGRCNVLKSILYHDLCIRSLKKLLFIHK